MNQLKDLEIIPTTKALGAEVKGINFSLPLPDNIRSFLVKQWNKHLVLLFRNQELTQEQHINAAKFWGEIQISAAKAYYIAVREKEVMTADYPEISVVHNLDKNGNPVMNNNSLGSGEIYWHSDNSYIETPPSGSMLYARIIPPHGGNTYFSNQYLAYETLPNNILKVIEGRTAIHDSSRDGANVARPGVTVPTNIYEVIGPHHPIVRTHPLTRKKALYLGRRRKYPSQYIDGITEEESTKTLDFLWNHATKQEFVWCHNWKVGDLLLWDNRCTMHYRAAHDKHYKRVLHRILIKGEKPI